MSQFDQPCAPQNLVVDILGNKIHVRYISSQMLEIVKRMGAFQRGKDGAVWVFECADDDELVQTLLELNRLGFLFAGGHSGYPAADVFGLLLEAKKLSVKFKEVLSRGPGDWYIIERGGFTESLRRKKGRKKRLEARMEEKIKDHYRRPSDDQPPPDAVIIPPLTEEQYVAMENWNVAAQIATWAITIGLTAGIGGAIGSRGGIVGAFAGGVIGTLAGAIWGAYEANCIASVQDEFEEAYKQSGNVVVWREGWKFNVDGNSGDYTYTQANGPLSALYVAGTTLILTGKIP